MRAATLGWVVGFMVLGSVARAQNTEPACAMGYQSVLSYGPPGHGSGAYFETAKSTFEQKLGDGSYVRGYAITHQARDGAGRTMSEVAMSCQRGEDGVPRPQLSVNVFDPATKTSLNWQVNGPFEKVAHVFHQPSPAPAAVKTLSAEQLALRKKAALALQKPCPCSRGWRWGPGYTNDCWRGGSWAAHNANDSCWPGRQRIAPGDHTRDVDVQRAWLDVDGDLG